MLFIYQVDSKEDPGYDQHGNAVVIAENRNKALRLLTERTSPSDIGGGGYKDPIILGAAHPREQPRIVAQEYHHG